MPNRRWTAAEDDLLRDLWPTHSLNECARLTGRGYSSVWSRANILGLKRDSLEITTRTRWPSKTPKPYRKGGARPRTEFRDGQHGNKWRPIGSERINCAGYLLRKVADTGKREQDWRPVHVIEWEAANGPLPEGHFLIFRNSDRRDIALDNLKLVTPAENMIRNSIHARYPQSVASACKRLGWIKRKLKRLEEHHERQR